MLSALRSWKSWLLILAALDYSGARRRGRLKRSGLDYRRETSS